MESTKSVLGMKINLEKILIGSGILILAFITCFFLSNSIKYALTVTLICIPGFFIFMYVAAKILGNLR